MFIFGIYLLILEVYQKSVYIYQKSTWITLLIPFYTDETKESLSLEIESKTLSL